MECDVTKKCRACLTENKTMLALFDNYENNLSLANILQSLLSIELNICDNLPKVICEDCATLLIQFYNFSVVFQENTKKLESFIDNDEKDDKYILDEEKFKEAAVKAEDILLEDKFFICDEIKDEEVQTLKCETNNEGIYDGNIEDIGAELDDCNNCEEIVIRTTNSEESVSNAVKYECNICYKKYSCLTSLKQHLQIHMQKKIYICEFCGYISLRRACLADHMAMHKKEKPYVCNFCGKTFRQRSSFSRHKKIHTNPMQVICEMCGQKFTDRGTLKTHILLLHIKSRNFKCIICNRSFPLKGTLDKHLRRHQQKEGATKNFSCSKCHMKYFDKSSLTRHFVMKHSGKNMNVKCQYCDKEYTAKNNLLKHIKSHHKNLVKSTT